MGTGGLVAVADLTSTFYPLNISIVLSYPELVEAIPSQLGSLDASRQWTYTHPTVEGPIRTHNTQSKGRVSG